MKEEEDLIKCPVCGKTEYIFERDVPVIIFNKFTEEYYEYTYFCGYCRKDF